MENSVNCPRQGIDPDAWQWIGLYRHYEAGHLYFAGGVADQPAIYLTVMRLIDGAVKESRNG